MSTIKCKKCGKKLKEGQKFCPWCGKKLDVQRTCTKCGSLLEEDYKFCPECGTQIAEKQSEGYVHSGRCKHLGTEKFGKELQSEEIVREIGTTVERMREIVKTAQDQVSFGAPIGEEDSYLSDFIDKIEID